MKLCTIANCNKPHEARGYCKIHYSRFRNHGRPLLGRPVTTERGAPLEWLKAHTSHVGKECLIWPFGRDSRGYAVVYYKGNDTRPHRIFCEYRNGPPPTDRHEVAHSCGNGLLGCVNPCHLNWKTHAENLRDKVKHGTTSRGEKHVLSKLVTEQVRAIRTAKGTHKEIAQTYGISRQYVADIISKRAWGWLA